MMISSHPEPKASSTPYEIIGLFTSGSISLAISFVTGKNLVPNPATGNKHFLTLIFSSVCIFLAELLKFSG